MRNAIATLILLACDIGWALVKWVPIALVAGLTYYMIQFWPGESALYGKGMDVVYVLTGFAWILTCIMTGVYWSIEFSQWWTDRVVWAKEQKRRQEYEQAQRQHDFFNE